MMTTVMRRPSTISTNGASDVMLRVLVIEPDGPSQAARTLLAHAGRGRFVVAHASGVPDGIAWLGEHVADCVLLDLGVPGEALDGLARLRAAAFDAPVLVLSGPDQDELGARAVHEGAQDHLVKGQVDARGLARAIGYAIERSRAQVALAHQALHDPLTGLANRALFEDRLRQALARSRRHGVASAVLFCDLDRFKDVNDRLGHAAGDSCSSRSPGASPASCAPRTRRRASGATSSRSSARTSTAPTTRWPSPSGCSTSSGAPFPGVQRHPGHRVDRPLDRPRGHRAPGGAAPRGGRCDVPREGPRR